MCTQSGRLELHPTGMQLIARVPQASRNPHFLRLWHAQRPTLRLRLRAECLTPIWVQGVSLPLTEWGH